MLGQFDFGKNLSWFDQLAAAFGERINAKILLFDSTGTVLSSYRAEKNYVGRNFADNASVQKILAGDGGHFYGERLNGTAGFWGYTKLAGSNLRLAANIASSQVYAGVNQGTRQAIAVLAGVLLLIGGLIWFAGDKMFAEPMRELDELLQATLNNMDQGLMVVDKHGTLPICNRRALELLELPPELVRARPKAEEMIAFPQARGEFDGLDSEVRQRLLPRVLGDAATTYERDRPNGKTIEVRTVPFKEGGVVRTYTDLTERKKAERQLAESEARYRLLAENSTDMIFKLDLSLAQTYASPSCCQVTGLSAEQLTGARHLSMVHPDDVVEVRKCYEAIARGQEFISPTYRIRAADGHWIWVEAGTTAEEHRNSDRPS